MVASDSEKDTVALIRERYESASRNQQDVFAEMEECRLFFRGDQWLRYVNGKWDAAPPSPSWRVRLTINKLPPLVELLISTFLRYQPIITATPGSDETDDRKAAKTAQILLRYFWKELGFDEMLALEALPKVFIYGSSFVRASWDRDRKPRPLPKLDVISPFSFSVEPGALKLEDAGWCMTTELLRVDEVRRRFNTKDIEPEINIDEYGHIPVMVERELSTELKDRTALHIMYERPCAEYPKGRVCYMANNRLLHAEDLPGGEIRIVHLKGIPLPDEFWPTSVVSQVLPLQMELNRGRSQLIENRNLCSRPVILAAEGSLPPGSYKAKPGHIMYWDPIIAGGTKPEFMTPPHVPQWVTYLLQASNEDIMDLSSRHEVSQGQQSSQITSGRQAAIFRAADDSRLAPAIRSFENGLRQVGKYLLSTCKENMKGQQIVPIVGRGREGEVMRFMDTDIADNANINYDIASQIPWARENMRQFLMELNRGGKIDDETLFERLELPTSQSLYENEQEHRLNARTENDALAQMYIPPLPTDNDQVHLQEHERFINRPEQRQFFIAEMAQLISQQQIEMAEMSPEEQQQAQQQQIVPPSLQHFLKHMEEHKKEIPGPQPPPPAAKINLSLDRILQNPIMLQNPQLAQEILQLAMELGRDATGQTPTPSSPQAGPAANPRAAGAMPPSKAPQGAGASPIGITQYEQEMRGAEGL